MVQYDNSLAFSTNTNATETRPLTLTALDNRRLFAAYSIDSASTTVQPTITYAGVTLSLLTQIETDRAIYIYELVAPASGTNDLVVSWGATPARYNIVVIAVNDVYQGTIDPADIIAASESSGSTFTISAIPAAVNDLLLGFGNWNNQTTITEGASQSFGAGSTYGAGDTFGWVSYKTAASISESMSWDALTDVKSGIAFALNSAAPSTAILTLDQASISPGGTITFSTDLTGLTGANITDSLGNVFALTNVTDTSADVPALSHGLSACLFESDVTVTVTDGVDTATDTINLVAGTGRTVKTVSGLSGSLASKDWGYHLAGLADGDQIEYSTSDESFVVHNADGTSTVSGAGVSTVKAIDATDGVVSTVNLTYEAADETPDAFTFTDLTGQTRSVQIESNAITVTGIDAVDVPVSVTGGSWAKSTDGGSTWTAWSVDPGTVTLNDLVKVRHTTSASYSTQVDTTLTVNGVSDTFSTTTIAGDVTAPVLSTPSAFATGETTASGSVSTNEANGTLYFVATVNATETVATVKAGSSQAVSATGTQNGNVSGLTQGTSYYLHFVHTDAAGNDSGRVTSAQFTTDSAVVAPTMPVDVSVNVDEHTTLVGTYTASSGTAPITYSLSGADASLFNINSSTGEVNFVTAPNFEKDATSYAITVTGTNSAGSDAQNITVNVTDVAEDQTPDAFSFVDQTDVTQSASIESNAIAVIGVKAGEPIPVTITGGEYAVSTDGGSTFGGWTNAATNVELNYVLKVRHTSSALKNTTTSTTLTIGGVTDTFTSTTVPDLVAPVITLNGDSAYTILVGDAWAEPGYSAIDDTDGNITADVVIGGDTVDTSLAGTYVITYNVNDSEGNSANQVTRTISVVQAGIQSMPATISAGQQFDVNLFGVDPLQAGENWQGFIKVAANYYPLSIDTVTDTVVTVTAANDTPVTASPQLILQRVQSI